MTIFFQCKASTEQFFALSTGMVQKLSVVDFITIFSQCKESRKQVLTWVLDGFKVVCCWFEMGKFL